MRRVLPAATAGTACLLLSTIIHSAQAELVWRSMPEIAVRADSAEGHGHGHMRASAGVWLRDGDGAVLTFWKPTLEQIALAPMKPDGQVSARPSGLDNYHLLMATRRSVSAEEVALRYQYMHGKPSGESPSRLLGANKAILEIVPDPLPREHWRYETGELFGFTVRLEGKPLAGQTVRMVTTNGSFTEAATDARGRVRFVLPEDFAHVAIGRQMNAPAEFILSTAYAVGEKSHRTTLSADYHVNPSHWQSSSGGVLALFAGFAAGVALWRRLPTEGQSA